MILCTMKLSLLKQTRLMRMSSSLTDERRLSRCKTSLHVPSDQSPLPTWRVLYCQHHLPHMAASNLFLNCHQLICPHRHRSQLTTVTSRKQKRCLVDPQEYDVFLIGLAPIDSVNGIRTQCSAFSDKRGRIVVL